MTSAFNNPDESGAIYSDDPFGGIKQEKGNPAPTPRSVNFFHARADTDSSPTAAHHTLGTNHNQASYGDHIHDGRTSKKVGQDMAITISGSRGGNAALASLITALQQVIDITDNTTP